MSTDVPTPPPGKAARNERRKLRATTYNALGLALIVVGGVTPLFNGVSDPLTLLKVAMAAVFGYGLHHWALHELALLED